MLFLVMIALLVSIENPVWFCCEPSESPEDPPASVVLWVPAQAWRGGYNHIALLR